MISDIPFLECAPLEDRGADTRGAVEASTRTARNCDLCIRIFGREYSETTIKEYYEAVEWRIQCLTYVKRVKRRDERLTRFIERKLKNRFKFHQFRGKKDLYERIDKDLRRLVLEILQEGLEARTKSKEEAHRLETEEQRRVTRVPLEEAKVPFKDEDHLSSIVAVTVALELGLRKELMGRGIKAERVSIGILLNTAKEFKLIDEREMTIIREILYIRNAAIHAGKIPDRRAVESALEETRRVLRKLESIDR